MMKRILSGTVAAVSLWVLSPSAQSEQSDSRAGGPLPATMSATVHVNVLLIGFEQKTYFDNPGAPHDFQAIYTDVLPLYYAKKSDPVIRSETDYNVPPAYVVSADQHLDYRYHTHYASPAVEDRFFAYLQRVGRLDSRTPWQTRYNDQQSNLLDIPDQVLRISGADVERWLLQEVRRIQDFNSQGYTIVLINWFSRPDFQFHVFSGEGVDVDTGLDSRTDIYSPGSAWGGTHGRLWFYDLSAGPEGPTANWNVDDIEVTGSYFNAVPDGYVDYRVPPIWEFRQDLPMWLSNDATLTAAEFAYYVVHFLFTPSPIYDPLVSVPDPGGRRVLRLNYFDGDASVPSWEVLKPRKLERELESLQPYIPLKATLTERPLTGKDLRVFQVFAWSWSNVVFAPGCWEPFGHPVWEMYCYTKEHEEEFGAPIRPGDWAIPAMLYNTSNELHASVGPAPAGFADFDLLGKPYELFVQSWPGLRQHLTQSVGMTNITSHETGHHVGLSHEHDGWDGEVGTEIGAFFAKYVFTFDECHCTMSYIYESAGFGQFERDNVDRHLAARAYAETLRLLGSEDTHGSAAVEAHLRHALTSFQQMDWRGSVRNALQAYDKAVRRSGRRIAARVHALGAAGQDRRPHPGVVDPPPHNPDAQPEVQRLRSTQRVRQVGALRANERLQAMPGMLERATMDPNVRAYLEELGLIER